MDNLQLIAKKLLELPKNSSVEFEYDFLENLFILKFKDFKTIVEFEELKNLILEFNMGLKQNKSKSKTIISYTIFT